MGFITSLVAGALMAKKIESPKLNATVPSPAQPAATVTPSDIRPETGADSIGTILRKKAKGKQSLMIPTSGRSSGTGLNI